MFVTSAAEVPFPNDLGIIVVAFPLMPQTAQFLPPSYAAAPLPPASEARPRFIGQVVLPAVRTYIGSGRNILEDHDNPATLKRYRDIAWLSITLPADHTAHRYFLIPKSGCRIIAKGQIAPGSAIHLTPVSHRYDQLAFVDFANHAIVADTNSPQAAQVAFQERSLVGLFFDRQSLR